MLSPAEFGNLIEGYKLLDGGLEHQVFYRKRAGRVFKITMPPHFGAMWYLKDYIQNYAGRKPRPHRLPRGEAGKFLTACCKALASPSHWANGDGGQTGRSTARKQFNASAFPNYWCDPLFPAVGFRAFTGGGILVGNGDLDLSRRGRSIASAKVCLLLVAGGFLENHSAKTEFTQSFDDIRRWKKQRVMPGSLRASDEKLPGI